MPRTTDSDACPGALQVHQAADGPLARVRLPGGMITAEQLEVLAQTATRFAAGTLELTARGNLQLRGITDTAAVADAVTAAGLLPSVTHERVRNIVASPLSGRTGDGVVDVRPWVAELDRAIQDCPDLAGLPGRFLFSIDDGRADVSGLAADAGLHAEADGASLLLAGSDSGVRVGHREAIPALVAVARRFAGVRGNAWRVLELDDHDVLLDGFARSDPPARTFGPSRPPVGWIEQSDGKVTLGAAVPLGVLSARQAQFVAAIGAPVVITPWRSLLVCDLDEGVADASLRMLPPLGLVFDETSRWLDVTACVGSPGCDRSLADVRADAARVAESGSTAGPVHYVGCERACGSPLTAEVMVATGDGYRSLRGPAVG
ncbi:MAG: precorrin-3B synthase [Mycobacterium sp.]